MIVKTLLGFMDRSARKSFVETVGQEGWIQTLGVGALIGLPSIFVAPCRGFVEKGDDAMVQVGHDGVALPLSEPWRR